jgi:hypothetical protein
MFFHPQHFAPFPQAFGFIGKKRKNAIGIFDKVIHHLFLIVIRDFDEVIFEKVLK